MWSAAFGRRWWGYLFPFLVYGALIFFLSAQSRWPFEPPEFFSVDKLYHLLEYGVFGLLAARIVVEYHLFSSPRWKITAVVLVSLLYGVSDEIHQWFVPGRYATVGDVLADTLGGGLGGWFFLRLKTHNRSRGRHD